MGETALLTGLAYYHVRRYSEAIEELKQVIALNPNRAQAHYDSPCLTLLTGSKLAQKQQQILEAWIHPAAKIANSSRPA